VITLAASLLLLAAAAFIAAVLTPWDDEGE